MSDIYDSFYKQETVLQSKDKLVSETDTQLKLIQGSLQNKLEDYVQNIKQTIQNKPLFIMFEKQLNCNPKTDHLTPKNIYPLFEKQISSLTLSFQEFVRINLYDLQTCVINNIQLEFETFIKEHQIQFIELQKDADQLANQLTQLINNQQLYPNQIQITFKQLLDNPVVQKYYQKQQKQLQSSTFIYTKDKLPTNQMKQIKQSKDRGTQTEYQYQQLQANNKQDKEVQVVDINYQKLLSEFDDASKQLQQNTENNQNLMFEIEQLKQSNTQYQTQVKELKQQSQSLQNSLTIEQNENQQHQKSILDYNHNIAEKQEIICDLEAQLRIIKKQHSKDSNSDSQDLLLYQQRSQQIQQLKQQLESKNEEINLLTLKNQQCAELLANYEQQLNTININDAAYQNAAKEKNNQHHDLFALNAKQKMQQQTQMMNQLQQQVMYSLEVQKERVVTQQKLKRSQDAIDEVLKKLDVREVGIQVGGDTTIQNNNQLNQNTNQSSLQVGVDGQQSKDQKISQNSQLTNVREEKKVNILIQNGVNQNIQQIDTATISTNYNNSNLQNQTRVLNSQINDQSSQQHNKSNNNIYQNSYNEHNINQSDNIKLHQQDNQNTSQNKNQLQNSALIQQNSQTLYTSQQTAFKNNDFHQNYDKNNVNQQISQNNNIQNRNKLDTNQLDHSDINQVKQENYWQNQITTSDGDNAISYENQNQQEYQDIIGYDNTNGQSIKINREQTNDIIQNDQYNIKSQMDELDQVEQDQKTDQPNNEASLSQSQLQFTLNKNQNQQQLQKTNSTSQLFECIKITSYQTQIKQNINDIEIKDFSQLRQKFIDKKNQINYQNQNSVPYLTTQSISSSQICQSPELQTSSQINTNQQKQKSQKWLLKITPQKLQKMQQRQEDDEFYNYLTNDAFIYQILNNDDKQMEFFDKLLQQNNVLKQKHEVLKQQDEYHRQQLMLRLKRFIIDQLTGNRTDQKQQNSLLSSTQPKQVPNNSFSGTNLQRKQSQIDNDNQQIDSLMDLICYYTDESTKQLLPIEQHTTHNQLNSSSKHNQLTSPNNQKSQQTPTQDQNKLHTTNLNSQTNEFFVHLPFNSKVDENNTSQQKTLLQKNQFEQQNKK